MTLISPNKATEWTGELDTLRCVACDGRLLPASAESEASAALAAVCEACGHVYPIRDGVLVIKEDLAADNKIAADFYNSPLWPKFRFWERFFWVCNGGERRSRDRRPRPPVREG